jgi:hypothetical protein
MKKLVLTTVCALAVSGAAFAQGTVTWANFGAAFIAQTNSSSSPLFGGTGVGGTAGFGAINNAYYYELLYNTAFAGSQVANPTAAQLFGGTWLDTGLQAVNGPGQNGRIVGNPANTGANLPATWNTGTTNNVILVGWSADLGTTWLSVSNILAALSNGNNTPLATQLAGQQGFFGDSVTGFINPSPTGTSPGAIVFGPSAIASGLPINNPSGSPAQLYLLSVPEPATMALVGLGGLSLMLFRRQRK